MEDAVSTKADNGADNRRANKAEKATDSRGPSITVMMQQPGGAKPVTGNVTVSAGTVLKVSATGGQWVTVVAVRNSGQAIIYGRGQIPEGGPGVVAFKVAPTSSRTPEAIFVVLSDTPVTNVTPGSDRDSNRLPITLNVDRVIRRVVINVTPSVD